MQMCHAVTVAIMINRSRFLNSAKENPRGLQKYDSQWLLCLLHPGSNTASSVDFFLGWPTPFILVLGRLNQGIKTRSESRDADGNSYLRQKFLALPNLSVQRSEECGLILRFCQYLIDVCLRELHRWV